MKHRCECSNDERRKHEEQHAQLERPSAHEANSRLIPPRWDLGHFAFGLGSTDSRLLSSHRYSTISSPGWR
jgi:hypothetical protein